MRTSTVTQPLRTICAYSTYEILVLRGYTWIYGGKIEKSWGLYVKFSQMHHEWTTLKPRKKH